MTDDEKKAMMDAMDAASNEAKAELETLDPKATKIVAAWFFKHYAKAGHKRLGRVLVAHAKK